MLCRTSLRTVSCNRTREDQPKDLRPIFCLHRSPNIRAAQEPACTLRRCSRNRPHTMSTRTDSKRPRQPRPELRCTAVRPVRALRRAPLAALLPQLLHPSQPRPPRIRPPQTRRPSPSWNSCDSRSCSARWKLSKHACSAFPLRWLGGYSGFALHRVSKPVERGLDHDTCDKERRTFRKSSGKRFSVVSGHLSLPIRWEPLSGDATTTVSRRVASVWSQAVRVASVCVRRKAAPSSRTQGRGPIAV